MTRSGLRASAVATALAAMLAVLTPATTRLAASPEGASRAIGGSLRSAPAQRGPHPSGPITRVLAESGAVSGSSLASTEDPKPSPGLMVHVPASGLAAHQNPWGSSPVVGRVVASSKYYHVPLVAFVKETNPRGTWGRVALPYAWPHRDGWIPLAGLRRETTWITVDVDLSARRVTVRKRGDVIARVAGAIGSPTSPTPTGDYFVTDRIPFAAGSSLGTFAFGISGVQPRLPAGWSGGNQLAIHGTNQPWSIGRSASAGCIRVSEWALDRLRPLLRLGTPVRVRA
jgi:hypothetical protein